MLTILKFIVYCSILNISLFALEVDEKVTFNELLTDAKLYIDHNRSTTIENIDEKTFHPIHHKILGFGYSPDFNVWIKFTLTNSSSKTIHKIIEYDNPLTSYLSFFDASTHQLLQKDGLLRTCKERNTIHPIFKVTLLPQESKTFYIKAHSEITTLILKLNLWNSKDFYEKEIRYQFILALFFGALGIIIIYNFIIYLATKEKGYLYYVLAFVGITIYYLLYKGFANIYLIPSEYVEDVIRFSSFIVAIPIFFLALFTKHILNLQNHPHLNRILNYALALFLLLTVILYILDLNKYRSLPSVILLFIILSIVFYAFKERNRQAKFILIGWIIFFTSGLFMFLSSKGIYDIYALFPHYGEYALIVEAIAFSLSLADKIKQLNEEKLENQTRLIAYQKEEKERLSALVKEKTNDLQKSLTEKELLLQELNHRVKNSMQTIISFLRLQIDETKNEKFITLLETLENRIFAINNLYALLHTSENISTVNMYNYFSLLINNLQKSFHMPSIHIHLKTDITMTSDNVIYCGFILNEAITNAYQHAFAEQDKGDIYISLLKEEGRYCFTIKDNGSGYEITDGQAYDSLGMLIIETLALEQLEGELQVNTTNGVEIKILWRDHA